MIRDNYLDVSKLVTDNKILELFDVVANNGGVLRFVGGAVRDALKGIKSSDLNFATDLTPEELVEACTDAGIETVPLGIKQGSVGVIVNNKIIEVSSLSKYILKNDLPELVFTDNWEEDAARRDLTINAVYADEKGNVFDYYNGIEDLERGYVRFIGIPQQKIREDYLRILRYFRFYSLFGVKEPHKKSFEACVENCEGLKKEPMEGICEELFKILMTPNVCYTYKVMQENGILSYVLPDAKYLNDLECIDSFLQNNTIENCALIKFFIIYNPSVALAENLATRLKFSRQQKELFVTLASENHTLDNFLNRKHLTKIVYDFGIDYAKAKFLTLIAQNHNLPIDLNATYNSIKNLSEPVFPIKGKDLLNMNIATPSQIGSVLKKLEKLWLESEFELTKEELLQLGEEVKDAI